MLFNIVFGFVLPWICCYYLIKRDMTFVLRVSTIGALVAFLINNIAYFMNWWYVTPKKYGSLSVLPYNIGAFSVLAVFTIHMINKGRRNWIVILIMSFVETMLESILVYTGKIVYLNGWNLSLTFFSYLFATAIGYFIYRLSTKIGS